MSRETPQEQRPGRDTPRVSARRRTGLFAALVVVWCTTVALAARGATTPAVAGEATPRYVVGLSPFFDAKVKDELYRHVVRFLLEDIPLDSSLWICDAYRAQTIARIDVPNVSAFHSAKTRANQFKEPVRKLREFLIAEPERPRTPVAIPEQAVRLPQFMDFVGENRGDRRPLIVIVLGNPLYVDVKEPSFSMLDGYFPSDGHLAATREESVYGLKARERALDGVTLHFGWYGDPWVSDVHRDRIQRFWTLYLQGQGARLASFCGDPPVVFSQARALGPAADPHAPHFQIDPAQTKIEMLRIARNVGLADWITRDTLPNLRPDPPSKTVGTMKIGIRWRGDIDLDLYARPTADGETLFFQHTRSPEGYYFKDHRSSPDREYEFIEFESPVDVFRADAQVNFYQGNAPGGPSGEVRIEFDGRIYTGRFALSADHGNQGRTGRSQTAFWTRLDIPTLLHLRGERIASEPSGSASRQR